ncbi:MAG TPA: zf-HC2 domain-containing protein [bacterium]|nr:zf-HC2 domain-containing protein [bacterium]
MSRPDESRQDEHLQVYLLDDPETGEDERRGIELHLKSCGDCRTSLESFRRARRLLQSPMTVPEGERFVTRILSRVEAEGTPRTPGFPKWLPASLLAAVLALAAGLYFMSSPATTTQDLLAAGDEGGFYEWATASGTPSEDEVLAFVLEDL